MTKLSDHEASECIKGINNRFDQVQSKSICSAMYQQFDHRLKRSCNSRISFLFIESGTCLLITQNATSVQSTTYQPSQLNHDSNQLTSFNHLPNHQVNNPPISTSYLDQFSTYQIVDRLTFSNFSKAYNDEKNDSFTRELSSIDSLLFDRTSPASDSLPNNSSFNSTKSDKTVNSLFDNQHSSKSSGERLPKMHADISGTIWKQRSNDSFRDLILASEDSENKMKRRYVNEQKSFNQDDRKIWEENKAKTQDKMEQWNNYQNNFTTLKKQLNPKNSSFPVSRQTKSTHKQYSLENGIQTPMNQYGQLNLQWIDNQNSIVYSGVDELDLLPEEDRYRFMDSKHFCDKCFCGGLKSGSLKCSKNNQINFIPILPYQNRTIITEILIENQDHFYELNEEQLKYYPNVTKLTIQNSGLREVREKSFKSTAALKEINLRRNKLKALQRKLFDDLQFTELSINENPFTCNCSVKWIQLWLNNSNYYDKLGVSGVNITCVDYSNATKLIKEALMKGCELPVVKLDATSIQIKEGQNFTIRCNATADPVPSITWNTLDFKSKYNIKTILNPNNLTSNSTNLANVTNGSKKEKNKILGKMIEIFNASPYDNGPFYCTGENIVGRVNAVTNVTIFASPKIESLKPEKKFYWCVNYRVTGMPTPKRTWYFNGKLLALNDTIEDKTLPNMYTKRGDFVITGYLSIKSESNVRFSGNYTLKIENEFGQVNKTAEVKIVDILASVEVKNANEVPTKLSQTENLNENQNNDFIRSPIKLGLTCFGVVMLVVFVAVVFHKGCIYYSKNHSTPADNKIVTQEKIPLTLSRSMVDNPNYLQEKQHQMLRNFKNCHIDSKRIVMIRSLGEGAFGRVYLGTVRDLEIDELKNDRTFVAVKVLKHMPEQMTNEFEREANTLLQLKHENIVTFHGVSVDQHPFMMIFEYMKLGDLNSFLRSYKGFYSEPNGAFLRNSTYSSFQQLQNSTPLNNNDDPKESSLITSLNTQTYQTTEQDDDTRESDALIKQVRKISVKRSANEEIKSSTNQPVSTKEPPIEAHSTLTVDDLFTICIQVCKGMDYLAFHHFVHRDLSTRNCLVTKENGELIVKIGDFGMSRDIYLNDYYRVGMQTILPIRWMSPESIVYRRFTLQSDCWSFGVLLWEVWTLGKQPFFELSNLEVIEQVEKGRRLVRPIHCPDEVYELMKKCWDDQPIRRPSMAELHKALTELHEIHQKHLKEKCESVL